MLERASKPLESDGTALIRHGCRHRSMSLADIRNKLQGFHECSVHFHPIKLHKGILLRLFFYFLKNVCHFSFVSGDFILTQPFGRKYDEGFAEASSGDANIYSNLKFDGMSEKSATAKF